MKIESIKLKVSGFVRCRSAFYTAQDSLCSQTACEFHVGTNWLRGEIDSGIWAMSYLLSMYGNQSEDFILHRLENVLVNGTALMALKDLMPYTCYMDGSYPLFSSKYTVEELVKEGLRCFRGSSSAEDVRRLFSLDEERFQRPLSKNGNEKYRAMAAIGYCHGKQIFCFPWMSAARFASLHANITEAINALAQLGKIVIVPLGGGG